MWSSLGSAPGSDEVEVTVMGPGHGESIVVHLGKGEWMVVDSCLDTEDGVRLPAPLRYLRSLGVDVDSSVKLVVISHWDDDHIRGISEVVRACSAAKICFSTALTKREFVGFVEAVALGGLAAEGGNISELKQVLAILGSRSQRILAATPGRTLIGIPKVTSWSPSDYEAMQFLQFVAQEHPKAGKPLRKAVPGSPNLTSVVLSIDWPGTSALLGADMETHSDTRRGWGAVVSEALRIGFKKGQVVKIPHHGSDTGHDDRMWSELLDPNPISVIAPFGRGPSYKRPPKSSDVARINRLSSATFLTAKREAATVQKKDVAVARSLRDGMIRMTSTKSPIGIVQLRRKHGADWQHRLFGSARRAK